MNILIVDDDIILLDSLQELLSNKLSVSKATTGFDAIKLCAENRYDAIIIDFDFGDGINGIEIAKDIREYDNKIKIIIFSAYHIDILGKELILNLEATFLEKPINGDKLLKIIYK